jgi:hypothetical protein
MAWLVSEKRKENRLAQIRLLITRVSLLNSRAGCNFRIIIYQYIYNTKNNKYKFLNV